MLHLDTKEAGPLLADVGKRIRQDGIRTQLTEDLAGEHATCIVMHIERADSRLAYAEVLAHGTGAATPSPSSSGRWT